MGVAVAGNYAYVADTLGGLRIIDVTDPAAPSQAGFYDTPGDAYSVAVAGNYAYVADDEGGLIILRFMGEGSTYSISSISGRVTDGSGNPISGVTISDGAGHTATTDSNGNYTLSGLAAGTYTIPSKSGYTFWPTLRTVSVPPSARGQDFTGSPTTNVELVGQIGGATYAVAVQGDYAYIGEGADLAILDVSHPTSPILMARIPLPVSDLVVIGDYAYVLSGGALRVLDVSDPADPTEVGACDTPGVAVVVAEDYAYIAAREAGLRVVDVSDPANPFEVAGCERPMCGLGNFYPYDVAVAGEYAYVIERDSLRVMDISDPANPSEVGNCDTPEDAERVVVVGNYAYITDSDYTPGLGTGSIQWEWLNEHTGF